MDSKFKSFIVGLLRRGSMRWKPTQEALKDAKETYYIDSKNGKKLKRVKFKCNICGNYYCRKEVCVDHIQSVVSEHGFTTWDEYITRMFVPKSGYQILCKFCHKIKTQGENLVRKNNRKNKVDK